MRCLVTGGAGFIGHHLVRTLVERGDDVRVIDSFSTGFPRRVAPLEPTVQVVEGDVRDANDLDAAMVGREVVFHLAAIPSVQRSLRDPLQSNEVNVAGTLQVVLAAARAGVRRIVYASSSAVYGAAPILPRREDQLPDPRSPYAAGKLAGEHYLHALGATLGIETVALRYFNIFGPDQDPASEYAAVVPRFATAALDGSAPVVYGDGLQSRDFTHVDNAVAANILAATAGDVAGLTCNVGCGGRYTLLDLLEAIGEAIGTTLRPRFEAPRPGDVRHSQADIGLAAERLGYAVTVPFEAGIRQTVDWYREQRAAASRPT